MRCPGGLRSGPSVPPRLTATDQASVALVLAGWILAARFRLAAAGICARPCVPAIFLSRHCHGHPMRLHACALRIATSPWLPWASSSNVCPDE